MSDISPKDSYGDVGFEWVVEGICPLFFCLPPCLTLCNSVVKNNDYTGGLLLINNAIYFISSRGGQAPSSQPLSGRSRDLFGWHSRLDANQVLINRAAKRLSFGLPVFPTFRLSDFPLTSQSF